MYVLSASDWMAMAQPVDSWVARTLTAVSPVSASADRAWVAQLRLVDRGVAGRGGLLVEAEPATTAPPKPEEKTDAHALP